MRSSKIPPAQLFVSTLRLLDKRPYRLTLAEISKATGLPKGWLSEFSRNPSEDASVSRVELLHNFLTSQAEAHD